MDTLVSAYPQVVVVAFDNAVDRQVAGHNQFLLVAVAVEAQLVQSDVTVGNQYIAGAGDVRLEEVIYIVFVMAADAL